jgi:hypothetical protein
MTMICSLTKGNKVRLTYALHTIAVVEGAWRRILFSVFCMYLDMLLNLVGDKNGRGEVGMRKAAAGGAESRDGTMEQ